MKYRYQSRGKVFEVTLERYSDPDGRVRQRAIIDGLPYEFEILDDQGGADGRSGALTLLVDPVPQAADAEPQTVGAEPLTLKAGTHFASGRPVTVHWAAEAGGNASALGEGTRGRKWFSQDGCAYTLEKPAASQRRRGEAALETHLRAPMPAQVRMVAVVPGQEFEPGQTLLVLEAMKMEIRLQSPRAGRVQRLLCQVGEQVNRDQVLIEF